MKIKKQDTFGDTFSTIQQRRKVIRKILESTILVSQDVDEKLMAVKALGDMGGEFAEKILLNTILSPTHSKEVKMAALEELHNYPSPDIIFTIRQKLGEFTGSVYKKAKEVLARNIQDMIENIFPERISILSTIYADGPQILNNVKPFKHINISAEEGEIILMPEENCPNELLEIRNTINGETFFYKVYGIDKAGSPKELGCWEKDEYMPIAVKIQERIDNLFVLISKKLDEEILKEESILLSAFNNVELEEGSIKNLICIFIEVDGIQAG